MRPCCPLKMLFKNHQPTYPGLSGVQPEAQIETVSERWDWAIEFGLFAKRHLAADHPTFHQQNGRLYLPQPATVLPPNNHWDFQGYNLELFPTAEGNTNLCVKCAFAAHRLCMNTSAWYQVRTIVTPSGGKGWFQRVTVPHKETAPRGQSCGIIQITPS